MWPWKLRSAEWRPLSRCCIQGYGHQKRSESIGVLQRRRKLFLRAPKRRLLACVLAVMLCMAAFSIPAYAEGGNYQEYEIPPEENANVLDPDGNMTLVSDIAGEAASAKEFLTVVSKNNHYFYIVIERDKKGGSNVHFLNQVDEADLLALLSEEEREAYQQAQPVETPQPTPVPTPTPTQQPDAQPETVSPRSVLLLVLIAGLGVLIFLYLRSQKGVKPRTKGNVDLEDYDYGDEDDEEDFAAQLEQYEDETEGDDA